MLAHLLATVLLSGAQPPVSDLLTKFRMRFPELDAIPDERVQYWLDDATETLGPGPGFWGDRNYGIAVLLLAAHNASMGQSYIDGDIPAGVTQMRSGQLSLSFDAGLVSARADGGYGATPYGAQFLALLKLTRGGPRVTGLGVPACSGYWRDSLLTGVAPY